MGSACLAHERNESELPNPVSLAAGRWGALRRLADSSTPAPPILFRSACSDASQVNGNAAAKGWASPCSSCSQAQAAKMTFAGIERRVPDNIRLTRTDLHSRRSQQGTFPTVVIPDSGHSRQWPFPKNRRPADASVNHPQIPSVRVPSQQKFRSQHHPYYLLPTTSYLLPIPLLTTPQLTTQPFPPRQTIFDWAASPPITRTPSPMAGEAVMAAPML